MLQKCEFSLPSSKDLCKLKEKGCGKDQAWVLKGITETIQCIRDNHVVHKPTLHTAAHTHTVLAFLSLFTHA